MEEDKKSWNFKRIFILARQLLKVLDQIGYLQMGQVTFFFAKQQQSESSLRGQIY